MGTTRTSLGLARRWGALGLVLGAAAVAVPACSFAFDADTKQCSKDQDCTDKGFEKASCVQELCQPLTGDPIWGCLEEPPQTPNDGAIVSLALEVSDQADRAPRTDASVRACQPFDSACSRPIGDAVRVDNAGKATIQVSESFNGFLQVYGPKGPDVDDPDFVRLMVYFPTREVLRGARDRGILVFPSNTMKTLALLGGGTFEPDTAVAPDPPASDNGLVLLTTLNCASAPAAGISYALVGDSQRIEGKTSGFYTIGQAGSNLPSTVNVETDTGGAGGFTNVKAGLAVFTAKLNQPEPGRFITKETGTAVFVRPGWYTQVYVAP